MANFENETVEQAANAVMIGQDNISSLPITMAENLLNIFTDYLPLFLAVIIGFMAYQKISGDQWKGVLTKGITSILALLGGLFLTDKSYTIKSGDENLNIHYTVKAEIAAVELANGLANGLKNRLIFGTPKKEIDRDGKVHYVYDYSKSGFFGNRLDQYLQKTMDMENDRVAAINKSNENLIKTRSDIFKGIDDVVFKASEKFFLFTNGNNVIDIATKQVNGYRGVVNNPDKLNARLKLFTDNEILESSKYSNPSSSSISYYDPTFIKELSKIGNYADAWADTVKYDFTSKNKDLDKLLNKNLMSLFGKAFNPDSAPFKLPNKDGFIDSRTKTEYSGTNVENKLMKDLSSYDETLDNSGNVLIKDTYEEINSMYKDRTSREQAIADFKKIVTVISNLQKNIGTVREKCAAKVWNMPNVYQLEFTMGERHKQCVTSVQKLQSDVAIGFIGIKGTDKKDNNDITMSNIQQLFIKSPVGYALKVFTEMTKLKSVNTPFELNQPVTTMVYDTIEQQMKEVKDNDDLNKLYEENKNILDNSYNRFKHDFNRIVNVFGNMRTPLIETAVVDAERKNEQYKYITNLFNPEDLQREVKTMYLDESNNPTSWMELGYTFGPLKEATQTYTLLSLKKIDYNETVEKKMQDIQNVRDIYSDEAVVKRTKEVTNVLAAISETTKAIDGLFDSLSNPLKGSGSLLSGTFKTITSAFIIGKHAFMQQLYVEMSGAIVVAVTHIVPAIIWTIAVFVWIFKVSIIISILPLATFMVSYINFEQVKSAIMTLIHLMLTPVMLVCMFFISVEMANFLSIFIDKMLPILNLQYILEQSKPIGDYNDMFQSGIKWVADYFSDDDNSIGSMLNIFLLVKIIIGLFFQTMILLTAFLNTQEYLQMAIGSGGTNLRDGDSLQNKTLGMFRM